MNEPEFQEDDLKDPLEEKPPVQNLVLENYRKWFWIGIVVALLGSLGGLIIGAGLLSEKELQKEGWIIVGLSILSSIITGFIASNLGYL